MKPLLYCHSDIDEKGWEYIMIEIEPSEANDHDLRNGGKYLDFEMDHIKQQSKVGTGHWKNGVPHYDKTIKTWKDEILGEDECLKFADEYVK